tara:strand:+ start:4847 stop:7672 length:2826 start_codon:yes stop_codon:yes gene_type:complete
MSEKLYLIDGHALAYRTYFALTGSGFQGTARSGEPTAAIFGFTSVLLRLIEKESPDYLAVSFDVGKTFRDEMYPDYKATREKMPDDLRPQIERIQEVVDAFNIPVFVKEGYEADDVLGSLSRIAVKQNVHVVIVTGDRDLLQLVNEDVSVSLPGQSLADAKLYRPSDVAQKFGVTPDQFVDYKSMVGDKSDNIPGVAGVGDKTARRLLQQYLNLENIYSNLDKIEPRFQKKLAADKENAFLSKKLAAIVTDLELDFDLDACSAPAQGNFDIKKVEQLFHDLDFRTHLKRVAMLARDPIIEVEADGSQLSLSFGLGTEKQSSYDVASAGSTRTIVVDTIEGLENLTKCLSNAETIAFDTETTSTNVMDAELVGISLSVESGKAFYIPVGHDSEMAPNGQLKLKQVLEALSGSLCNRLIKKVAHNAKYDYVILKRLGLVVDPISSDTMLLEWISDPNTRNKSLKNLALVRLGVAMQDIQELIGKGKKQTNMSLVPVVKASVYAAADADMTLRLYHILSEELQDSDAINLLNMELLLIPLLAQMEMTGVLLDTSYLNNLSSDLDTQIGLLTSEIKEIVGYDFNLNSTQQLSSALFDHMSISPPRGTRRTASGHYSTAAGVLSALSEDYEVVRKILEYREISKLKSTYVDALPMTVNPETDRVHTSFNQTGTVTGRLASSSPNLQNIPIRSELGRQVRRAFVAPSGSKLVAMDYSQIELRIAAHLSGDEFLTNAFQNGVDIHSSTASAVFDVALDEVNSEQRRQAKAVNFGLLYGMGPYRLAQSTGITLGEAEEFIETYFQRLPGVKKYLDEIREFAKQNGFVQTLEGRRRYFPLLKSESGGDQAARARAEREAINAPIQGTAADIIKKAMIEVGQLIQVSMPNVRLLLQVHDELLFECFDGEVEELVQMVRPVMESAYKLSVPIKVDVNVGQNWEQMQTFSLKS